MCDTAVVVGEGGVIFGKNSDRDPNEAQLLEWVPRREHEIDSEVRCTYLTIPQEGRTHAVLLSRPFWMFGAEIGTNEHGVVIGNEAVFTKRRVAREGLTGMDLLRLALERATSAGEAMEVITSLLTAHGQGGGCGHEDRNFSYHNSYIIADAHGALVLETADREWELESVGRGARTISNGLTIPGFAGKHSDFVKTRVACARTRQTRTSELASAVGGPADMFALLRDHGGSAEPTYRWLNGTLHATCMHGGGVVAASLTTSSWVSELTAKGARHWVTATAAPCTSIYKPVRVDTPIEGLGDPSDQADGASLWWRHERLHRRVMMDPKRLRPLFAEERDALEQTWLTTPPEPQEAFDEASRALDRWTAAVTAAVRNDVRPGFARRYWKKRNRRAGLAVP